MTTTVISLSTPAIQLADIIDYSQGRVQRQTLLEDTNCRYILLSLPAGAQLAEHSAPRNATVNVIEGQGVLILEGKEIRLKPGVFVFMPATARHALNAETNLTVLLTLSERAADSN
ncbi:cupin domain-containing protein [Fischerella sp. PCC 9605]|uniref:cupin domain-containing protein n=1 Tax=Fischerella sp. PCC 9605 TaxID=1173024 RepID=UPI00047B9228|nr:cupin domain-containing protein [Fischerella sp. PCC 9605]